MYSLKTSFNSHFRKHRKFHLWELDIFSIRRLTRVLSMKKKRVGKNQWYCAYYMNFECFVFRRKVNIFLIDMYKVFKLLTR